jgi:hypothetical protein
MNNLAFGITRPLKLSNLYSALRLENEQQVESDRSLPFIIPPAGVALPTHSTRKANVVQAIRRDGRINTMYFDIQTGLLLRCGLGVPQGKASPTWYFEDCRDVDGLKMPYRLVYRQTFGRGTMIGEFDAIEANSPLSDSTFEEPNSR